MKLFTRIALVLLVFTLLIPATVFAQGGEDMPCFGLSAEDCELFYAMSMMMPEDFTSFAMDYEFTLTIPEQVDITSTGEGAWVLVDEMAADPLASFALSMDTQNVGTMEGETEEGPFSFVITDGNFYMSNPENPEEWAYFSLAEMMATSGIELDPSMMEGAMDPEMMTGMMDMVGPFMGMAEEYVTVTREADMNVDGNTVAVFTTTVDMAGFLNDPALTENMMGMSEVIGELAAQTGTEMSEEDLQMLPMMFGMIGMMFSDATITTSAMAGVDNGRAYGFTFALNMTLDPMMAASMMGETPEDPSEMEPLVIDMDLGVNIYGYDGAYTIEAPADAMEIDPESMQPMMAPAS